MKFGNSNLLNKGIYAKCLQKAKTIESRELNHDIRKGKATNGIKTLQIKVRISNSFVRNMSSKHRK